MLPKSIPWTSCLHLACASALVSIPDYTLHSYLLISRLLYPCQSDLLNISMRSHQPLPVASHFHHSSFSDYLSSFIPHHSSEWKPLVTLQPQWPSFSSSRMSCWCLIWGIFALFSFCLEASCHISSGWFSSSRLTKVLHSQMSSLTTGLLFSHPLYLPIMLFCFVLFFIALISVWLSISFLFLIISPPPPLLIVFK